jgi:hypothetical protein
MAVSTRNNIVTNGLVLYLDAANSKSYVSGSTTWSDVSGNGRNGTLVNGPTFSSENGGSIVFDGTNDRVNLGNILDFGTNDFTVELWCKKSSAGAQYPKVISKGFYQVSGWIVMTYVDSLIFAYGNPEQSVLYTFPYTITNKWIHGVITRISNQVTVYGNATPGTSATVANNLTSPYNFTIGANGIPGEFWGGNVSAVRVYNRALSAQEITQNYNATKTRFNLT